MRKLRAASAIAILMLLVILPAQADILVTFRNGKEMKTKSITYEKRVLKLANGETYPRDLVKSIIIRQKEQQETTDTPEPTKDVKELLKSAEEAVTSLPGAKSILLVDYGREEKKADGTWLMQYRSATKILDPAKLSELTSQSLYFDDERYKVRIIRARSIDPDGTVHNYDPASVKISKLARETEYFGRGKMLTYQIPEVKIGSIVDVTHEWTVFNPYDPKMFFQSWHFAGTQPFILSRIEVVMPLGQELYYVTRNMPDNTSKPRKIFGQDSTTYVWEMRNQPAVVEESRMPPVSDIVPHLECSPFKDWSYIKDWASKRLLPRIEPTPELEELVRKLTDNVDDAGKKIAILYHYVQRNIRYISVKGSIASDLCGHPGATTLKNKYGDCIDCANLFSALLRIAGVKAYPVWVNTNDSGSIPTEIATMGGNHAIVEVHLDGKIFHLDPTATNFRYPAFRSDNHGVQSINPILARISEVPVPDPSLRQIFTKYAISLAPSGAAAVKFLDLRTGSYEAGAREYFMDMSEEELERALHSYVNSYSPGAKLISHRIENLKDLSKQLEWHMEFTLPDYAVKAGDLLIFETPGMRYYFPEAAPEERKHDIDYKSSQGRKHVVTVNIPEGYRIKYLPPKLKLASKYVTYEASYLLEGSTITFEDNYQQMTRFVPVSDYAAHREFLHKIARYAKEHVFFEKKK